MIVVRITNRQAFTLKRNLSNCHTHARASQLVAWFLTFQNVAVLTELTKLRVLCLSCRCRPRIP
jgi:hypothetical protein